VLTVQSVPSSIRR